MNKKGMEIAVGTLVLIIISLVVFSYSIYFLYSMFSGAEEFNPKKALDDVDRLMKQEHSIIAIPLTNQQASEGESLEFWVGIRNVKEKDSSYGVRVDFQTATTLDGRSQLAVDAQEIQSWLGTSQKSRLLPISRREYASIPILLRIGSTEPGIYVFNICVFEENSIDISCKINNRNEFYNKEIKQITVSVS